MQKSTDTNVTPLTNESDVIEGVVVSEKQSFVQKTKTFVKNHKKPAIAVGALVGLVGASAFLGRKTAPAIDTLEIDIFPMELEETEVTEESSTPSSDEN